MLFCKNFGQVQLVSLLAREQKCQHFVVDLPGDASQDFTLLCFGVGAVLVVTTRQTKIPFSGSKS